MAQDLSQAPAIQSPENEQAPAEKTVQGSGNAAAQDKQQRAGSTPPPPGTQTAATGERPAQLIADPAALQAFFARDAQRALAELLAFPDADVAKVVVAARAAHLLDGFIGRLPSPPAVGPTRTGMRKLLRVGALQIAEAMALFGRRFRHGMTNEQTTWRAEVLAAVWDQLETLPDQDVSANTVLTTFNAINGGGGTGPAWSAPTTINTIRLGQAASPAAMGHTVRHEIGHAVHAQISGIVNPWLQSAMQFWFLGGDKAGVRQFLDALDTWPATFKAADGKDTAFGDTEKDRVAEAVLSWTGSGGWGPSRTNVPDGLAADFAPLWAAVPAKMKNGVAQSTTNWYNNYANFQTGTGGKFYFLNHYYHRPFHFGPKAAEVIRATGDSYTAMSEQEFFANSYAEYFKDPAGYGDHSKWGGNLPSAVKEFFKTNVLGRQPYTAPTAASPAAPTTQKPKAEGADETEAAVATMAPPSPSQMTDATGAGQPT